MSEESRLGRESIEVAYLLKQIIAAGVRVFFYLEDRERTLDSAVQVGGILEGIVGGHKTQITWRPRAELNCRPRA